MISFSLSLISHVTYRHTTIIRVEQNSHIVCSNWEFWEISLEQMKMWKWFGTKFLPLHSRFMTVYKLVQIKIKRSYMVECGKKRTADVLCYRMHDTYSSLKQLPHHITIWLTLVNIVLLEHKQINNAKNSRSQLAP